MIKVVIVEDEKPILDLMKVLIGRNSQYTIVGAFASPVEASDRMAELQPDVAFLDVEMPRMNGLELARKLNEICEHTKIVFTTAYKQYALDAFEVYAFDYILKPVTPAAIDRLTNRLIKERQPQQEKQENVPAASRSSGPSIRMFGGFEVRNAGGELVHWPTRKTEELFAYLLCHAGKDIGKWRLTELLWPEMDEERASHNLHNTLYRLKKICKEHQIDMDVRKTGGGYILDVRGGSYDVLLYQQYDWAADERQWDPSQVEHLISLYGGLLLEGKDYLWAMPLEEKLSKQHAALHAALVRLELSQGRPDKAEQRAEVYLSLFPLNEEINRLLFDAYARSGSKEKASRQLARYGQCYREEYGHEPSEEVLAGLQVKLSIDRA